MAWDATKPQATEAKNLFPAQAQGNWAALEDWLNDIGNFPTTPARIQPGAGSVGAPSYSTSGDLNTGIYFSAADTVDISAGGVRTASFATVATGVNYWQFVPSIAGASIELNALGTDTDIGILYDSKGTGAHIWRRAGGATEDARLTSGIYLLGTTVSTGTPAGAMAVANTKSYCFVNAAGTTSANYNLSSTAGNNMDCNVPDTTSLIAFRYGGNTRGYFQEGNSGLGLRFVGKSSADHAAPAANDAVLYTKDNGGGKNQLVVRFGSGAVQVLATEP